MATTTTNYGLTKPGYGDAADIAVINGNMDAIDDALDAKDKSMALVNDGDTAGANIASGAFVYVRGHTTLADGLYKASTAITSGATLSGSNLTSTSIATQVANIISALKSADLVISKTFTIASNKSVSANSETSSSATPSGVLVSGYKILYMVDVTISGTRSSYIQVYGTEINKSTGKMSVWYRNYASSSATITITATVLYVKNLSSL